jgi:K(+)-stimulated pyrophosphate-energized sodium pump
VKRAALKDTFGLLGSVLLVGVIGAALWTVASQAQEGEATEATTQAVAAAAGVPMAWAIAPVSAVLGLIFAVVFYFSMLSADEGDDRMKEIAGHVRVGAMAYLKRQYKVVAIVFAIMAGFFALLAFGLHTLPKIVPLAFLTGGFFSALAGWLGMATATRASNRTAAGAKKSLDRGLKVALRSGAVMGLVVVGLGLIDICGWFAGLYWLAPMLGIKYTVQEITVTMLTFGMGASLQALFARVGGGIFTKAADVGADLVGKVEAGIPEDDPRNPATIADNVGDNVGDVAGMGADLYESYCGSILASAALAAAAWSSDPDMQLKAVTFPMILAGLGVIASIIGVYLVWTKEGASQKQLMAALNRGVYGSSVLVWIMSGVATYMLMGRDHILLWVALTVGLVSGLIIGKSVEYYTSHDYKPTRGIAHQALTGPATLIIDGLAVGLLSTGIPAVTVAIAMVLAFGLAGGFSPAMGPVYGLYGVGIAAVGMLSTLGITLATDAYGPIADNAGGNAEMSGQPPEVRERTDALDALGNTTAAMGKGFAIGSAALTALTLLAAYLEEVRTGLLHIARAGGDIAAYGLTVVEGAGESIGLKDVMMKIGDEAPKSLKEVTLAEFGAHYDISVMNPLLLAGVFVGAMLAFVFCAFTMRAVGRAAGAMVDEVRRQFREIPGILEGKATPDYASCVSISTAGAQREMLVPSLFAVIVPILTGLVFGVPGVMGLLVGGLGTGFLTAIFMANAGGAWDNAKKYIEQGAHGGKGSPAHKAAVVGDTVGDPFKDTSGPSLNILIKLMSMVSIVVAGFVVKFSPVIGDLLGMTGK